jgi:hypothetical protein
VCELLLLTPDQVDRWEEACHEVGVDDTYYQHEYLAMVSANGDGEPRLAWLRSELGSVIYPFLERPVVISGADTGLRDITSPYGYGGPCVMSETEERRHLVAQEFCRTFHSYCVERRIVSEFIRFHPLLNNARCLKGVLPITAIRETVTVDLEAPLEQIWEKSLRGRARTAVRKARKLGVTTRVADEDGTRAFIQLYQATMDRLEADSYYYFGEAYFDHLQALTSAAGAVLEAWYEGRLIAAIVLLHGSEFAHYHLSASNPAYRAVQANSLLLWDAIEWAKGRGLSRFHLGGGYSGSDDALFKFKSGFSPIRGTFSIGKVVHDQDAYQALTHRILGGHPPSVPFFPAYRARVTPEEA